MSAVKSPVRTILCPTDWSEPSRVALHAAVNLARHEGAELLLLHVLPPLSTVRGITSAAPLEQMIREEAEQKLAALIAECVPDDVKATPLLRFGDEADEIHQAALGADVVVMSAHGRTSWGRLRLGSVAQKVLRQVPCPVFLVPHPLSLSGEARAPSATVFTG